VTEVFHGSWRKGLNVVTENGNVFYDSQWSWPDRSVIGKEGSYVTFAGSQQSVQGAHSTLKPGETYWGHDT
jgi:hypothetical protein